MQIGLLSQHNLQMETQIKTHIDLPTEMLIDLPIEQIDGLWFAESAQYADQNADQFAESAKISNRIADWFAVHIKFYFWH